MNPSPTQSAKNVGGRPPKDPRYRALSWPLSFMPHQRNWLKNMSNKWGVNTSRFVQSLVERCMLEPRFVDNAVIAYCNLPEEYGDLMAEKTDHFLLLDCLSVMLKNAPESEAYQQAKAKAEATAHFQNKKLAAQAALPAPSSTR